MVGLLCLLSVATACGSDGPDETCDVMYETERESWEALGEALCEWKARCGEIDPSIVDGCIESYADSSCDADCETGEPELPCGAINDCIANVEDLACSEGPVTNACNFAD